MANIFLFNDYKKFVQTIIDENDFVYGYKSKLAQAAGCQKSFFSQVLNSHIQFTPEHAIGLCVFWKFSALEREYFLNLVQFQRSGSPELQKFHAQKLKELKKSHENLSKRYEQEPLPESVAITYYSSWHYSAVHMLTMVPGFENISGIAKRLNLNPQLVKDILIKLKALDLVKFENNKWSPTKTLLHVPKESNIHSLYHHIWRAKAVEDSLKQDPNSIHYTSIYTLSKEDALKLKELVLEFIDRSRAIVEPSKEEDLVCFNMDYFVVD